MESKVSHALALQVDDSRSSFYGRENELNKLITILKATEGSATLVSGDRGSGKTSVIREAIKNTQHSRESERLRKHFGFGYKTRKHVIYLDVPLVPSTTTHEDLRKNVLRLMVQSLVSDYRSNGLFGKGTYPIGYRKRLNSIERNLLYKTITRSRNLGLKGAYKVFTAESSGTMEYEYDLAYADIELSLKDFFLKFSKHLEFIIVFDELDKYSEEHGSVDGIIKPHHYIRELKNLFTVTYAKFIFTSTESYYQEINEVLGSNALGLSHYRFNLFTHKVLLNHLEPRDYKKFLRALLGVKFEQLTPLAAREYVLFEEQMMWYTSGYPFLTKKKLSELSIYKNDGTRYIDLLNVNEDFSTYGTKAPALQYVIERTYHDHITKGELTNRYLFKSLKKVADLLYSGSEITVNKSHFYALIFADMEFDLPQSRTALFGVEFNPNARIDFAKNNEYANRWELLLDKSDSGVKKLVSDAVTDFIWNLDGLGVTITDFKDGESISNVKLYLTQYEEDELIDVIENFDAVQDKVQRTQESLRLRQRKISAIERSIDVSTHAPSLVSIPRDNGRTASGVSFTKGWELLSTIQEEIEEVESHMKVVNSTIGSKFMDELEREFVSYHTEPVKVIRRATRNSLPIMSLKLDMERGSIKLLLNPTKEMVEQAVNDVSIAKTVVVYGSARKNRPVVKNNFRLKYFYFSNDRFTNFSVILKKVMQYIEDYSK